MAITFLKQCWEFAQPRKRAIWGMIIITVLLESVKIVPTALFKEIIDLVSAEGSNNIEGIITLASLMFVAQMTFAWIDVVLDRKISAFVYWIEVHMPRRVQEKLLELPLGYHEKEQTGEKITRLDRGTWKVIDFACNFFWMVQPLLFQALLTVGILFYIDWHIGLIFICAVPVLAWLSVKTHKKIYPWRCEQEDMYEASSSHLAESIVSIKTVQAFAQERREHKRYFGFRKTIETIGLNRTLYSTRMNFWRFLVINIVRWMIVVLAGYKAATGSLSLGSVVLILTLSEKVYISFFNLNQVMDRMVEATEPMQRLFDLLETASPLKIAENPVAIIAPRGEVAFHNVGFSYNGSGRAVQGLSFRIAAGETVALVGPSGGGKSTIAKLIERGYDPQEGAVTFDGIDLRDLGLQDFRSMIGFVPQEVEIMSGTVAYNIAYGNPSATMEDIVRAAKQAQVDVFVREFKEGYDTLVGERGMKLSGGQRQRVGIARALLIDPAVLIFDEATSSLDTVSERAIQKDIERLGKTKTVIIIAHRLSTVKHADNIVVVQGGQCVEEGRHEDLVVRGGVYSDLVSHQGV